ncbi:WD repeat-containing protein 43-like [Babylonia areolata]|uniref:WD repeat-containing protein 43-like n=1 Tax=Babylonia areolata TaxID=304850 RepID=UPI003FD2D083
MAMHGVVSSFSQNGDYLAYSGGDGVVKIWETATGNPIADFTPNKQLTTTCTCLQWSRGRHLKSPSLHSPRKKKRRKSDVEAAVGDLGLIAIGTAAGSILLYSFSKGQLHTQLEKGHTDEVTDVSWHPNGTTLYSCSLDGHVIEWDVPSSQIKQKWKASSGGVHSIGLCGPNRLLTADRGIKMWDLTSRKIIQKFTGHSTEVFRLIPVLLQSSGTDDTEGETTVCSYFLSAAVNDRVINAWLCHPDSSEKNAITTFSLTEDPAELNLQVTKDQILTLSILTTKGKVLVFEHTLNGKLKKPLKPKTVVHAATAGSREEVSAPVPILAAEPRVASADSASLLVAHGSMLRPRFESVSLRPTQPETVLVVSNPEKKALKTDFSQVKTPEVAGSTVLYPGQMAPARPDTEPGTSRRKRKKSVSELTVVERLEAMGVDNPEQPSGSSKPPKADQLVVQLTQGLQSGDAKLLTNAFQERNEMTIVNTVKRLPLHVIHALVKEVIQRMYGHPQSGLVMLRWLKQIMCTHMAYLMTIPDIMETLGELNQYIQYRQHALPKRMEVQGKLNLLLSRVASQSQVDEPAASAEPLLVYQDESDEDDVLPMEVGASESEDNWEDSDAN